MIDAILRGSDESFRIESTGASQGTALGIANNSSMELTLWSRKFNPSSPLLRNRDLLGAL